MDCIFAPGYINQASTQDLICKPNALIVRFRLLSHSITYITTEGTKITTTALRIKVEYDY